MEPTKRKRKPVPALRPELEFETTALLKNGKGPEELAAFLSENGYRQKDAERLAADLVKGHESRRNASEASLDALIDSHAKPRSSLPTVLAFGLLALLGIGYMVARQPRDLGKPCTAQSDCQSGLCMLEVSADRRVTSGYCSKTCDGLSTCDAGLVCQDVVEGSGQPGQSWDGMMGKKHRACVKP